MSAGILDPEFDTDTNTDPLDMTLDVGPNTIKVKVTAETGGAVKTYTVTVTREAPTVTVPGAPTGLTATANGPNQINLDWTAPANTGNNPITGYRIEVSTDGSNGSWTDLEANTGNTDTTYAHTGLDPGDTRHYRVSARNVLGPGDPSDTDQATTLSGGICARTAQVRDAIVEEVMEADASVTTCADVTPAHLTSLDRSTWDLTSQNISSLKPGDFAGLTKLNALILERNALSSLPAGIFDPLTALTFLDLCNNPLTELTLPPVLYDRFITNPLDLCRDDNVRVTRAARRSPPPRRGGSSTPSAAPRGYLENPGADSFQSGIGVLSGWVCEGDEVEIEITTEGGEVARYVAAYGTERLDTQDACGDTNNGFGLLFNWNRLDDGVHEVVAYVDDEELGRATVTVTTLGTEFLRGAVGECMVPDFPTTGETVTLEWQQNSQNFVIVSHDPDGSGP